MKSFSKLSEDLEQRAKDMLADRKAQQARLEKEKTNKQQTKEIETNVSRRTLEKVRDAIENSRNKKKDLLDTLDDEMNEEKK